MMTCPDCKASLDAVPVGEPCPNCGSRRRDATVFPSTIGASAAIGPAQETNIAMAIDAFLSRPGIREAVATQEVYLRSTQPDETATEWLVEAWAGDDLIGMASDPKLDDALLAVFDRVADALREGGDQALDG